MSLICILQSQNLRLVLVILLLSIYNASSFCYFHYLISYLLPLFMSFNFTKYARYEYFQIALHTELDMLFGSQSFNDCTSPGLYKVRQPHKWVFFFYALTLCFCLCAEMIVHVKGPCRPHWVFIVSSFCPVLKAGHACTSFSSPVNTYWAVHEREMTASS